MEHKNAILISLAVLYTVNIVLAFTSSEKDSRHQSKTASDVYAAAFMIVLAM